LEIPEIVDAAARQLTTITNEDVQAFGITGNYLGTTYKVARQ
jgi:hypothetical protein